jgi:PKD domain/Secretion system C-terminal sorting domain
MQKFLFCFIITACSINATAQSITKRALFLGNSYTAYNSLPSLTEQVAIAMGDTLLTDSNTPGGYKFNQHCTDAFSLQKIALGTWDFVALQEQSQTPSFPDWQVQADCYPFAKKLDSLITAANPCTETVFYMTWGRKNGDASNCASFPVLCTYGGMDSLIRLRYQIMAADNNAILSPVGAVWRYIINNYPAIELYNADQSHPSLAGTYAAACTFYTVMFRKDVSNMSFNSGLTAAEALDIRTAVKKVVFDSLAYWQVGKFDAKSNFSYTTTGLSASFFGLDTNSTSILWQFGDGSTSTLANPMHSYSAAGVYTVTLNAIKCNDTVASVQTIAVGQPSALYGKVVSKINVSPNPANNFIAIEGITPNSTVFIFNTNGSKVAQVKTTTNHQSIAIAHLPKGLYLLQVIDDRGVGKMVKFSKE